MYVNFWIQQKRKSVKNIPAKFSDIYKIEIIQAMVTKLKQGLI